MFPFDSAMVEDISIHVLREEDDLYAAKKQCA